MDRFLRALTAIAAPNRRSVRQDAPSVVVLLLVLSSAGFAAACARPEAAAPLTHTFDSPEQLATAVVSGLERQDLTALAGLALSEVEFRAHVWPRLPASRPERNVPFDYVWGQLAQKSDAYLRAVVAEYGGKTFDVVEVRFLGETTDYGTFTVSRKAQIVVRDGDGQERRVRLFGSVLRQGDRFKLFSYVVD